MATPILWRITLERGKMERSDKIRIPEIAVTKEKSATHDSDIADTQWIGVLSSTFAAFFLFISWRKYALCLAFVAAIYVIAPICGAQTNAALAKPLSVLLAKEARHEEAALEFRRAAIDSASDEDRGHYYWAAAHEYLKAGKTSLAEKMLDHSEDALAQSFTLGSLLRGETAMKAAAYTEAAFHFEGLTGEDLPTDIRDYAACRLAIAALHTGNAAQAFNALTSAPTPDATRIEALEHYRNGSDKSRTIGGLLGIIPGLGYFYSGEYANGMRSMILNGIFIWGMATTARREEWGFFGVITFCEFTWYSGSIYGGIDAAERWNRERRDKCDKAIMGNASFAPDWNNLPIIELNFSF